MMRHNMVHDAYCICLEYIPQRILGIGISTTGVFYFNSMHNNTSPEWKNGEKKQQKDEFVTEIEQQGKGRIFLPFSLSVEEEERNRKETVEWCTLCVMIVVPRTWKNSFSLFSFLFLHFDCPFVRLWSIGRSIVFSMLVAFLFVLSFFSHGQICAYAFRSVSKSKINK